MRLIDMDALQEVFEAECVGECGCCKYIKHNPERCALLDDAPTVEAEPVRRGTWEVVRGVLTPGGDPLLRCPYCKSRESEHLCGVEHRVQWDYCPKCGAKLDNPYQPRDGEKRQR